MISNTSDFKNSTWQTYMENSEGYQNVAWLFTGKYDGKARKIYIKVKDELGNTSEVYQTSYKVYKSYSF